MAVFLLTEVLGIYVVEEISTDTPNLVKNGNCPLNITGKYTQNRMSKIKAKFHLHKNTVIIVWLGDSLGIGTPFKKGAFVARYSRDNFQKLVEAGARFGNRFVDAYPFPGHYKEPRECQRDMLDFQLRHHRAYNLSEMRTGKSGPVAWHIDIERKYNGKKRFVIFAPLSTLEDTWKSELFGINTRVKTFYSIHRTDGVRKLKKALLSKRFEIMVINFDKIRHCLDELIEYDPDCVFIDEASDFNDSDTKKYKALAKLMADSRRSLLALTGTARPNRPTDVWAIARLINPKTPARLGHFKQKTMEKHPYNQYKWIERPEAKQIVAKIMQPCIRFRTEDVDDMPDHEGVDVSCDLTVLQAKMFKEMKDNMITEDQGKVITAKHAGSRLWKLLQISSGVCRDEHGDKVLIGADKKIEEVKRLIRETPKKTVIMSSFTMVQHYIIDELKGLYKVGHINGQTPAKDRKKILDKFQKGDLDVLVCHPRPTRYGLKMHAASQIIWFGPIYSALDFEQGSARIRGPGTGKTVYVKLSACPLEREVYKLIDHRMEVQQESMDLAQNLKQLYATFLEK